MEPDRLRREICFRAAQLLCTRRESRFDHALWRAARSVTGRRIPAESIPTDAEIRMELQRMVSSGVAPAETATVDCDAPDEPRDQAALPATRFDRYLALLLPLDRVMQDRHEHPEGDVLYHSLQVFELARQQLGYDEEFLLAALLHDVGKGIDPRDHVVMGLEVLDGFISRRTRWLIENHALAHRILDGTIGHRARKRLQLSPDGEALETLAWCDREGRVPGRQVGTPEDAIDYVRGLADELYEEIDF